MRARGAFLVCAVAFVALYYACRLGGVAAWLCEALLVLPPAAAAAAHARRSQRERGRAAWFSRLIALGAAVWAVAQVLWTLAVFRGEDPLTVSPEVFGIRAPLDFLFLGFLVPMTGAIALRPHRRSGRVDPVAVIDTSLLLVAVAFVFARVVFLPLVAAAPSSALRASILGGLCLALGAWATALWRTTEDPYWRGSYGLLAEFAIAYGVLSALANNSAGTTPPPGGPLDLAWIVPFFPLILAAVPRPVGTAFLSGPKLILVAGLGPLAVDLLLPRLVPIGDRDPFLILCASALLAAGCALRLSLEDAAESEASGRARMLAEEERRAGRLGTLASMSASLIDDVDRAIGQTVARAEDVAPHLGEQGSKMLAQTRKARAIVRQLRESLRLVRPSSRHEIEVGGLLEETVRGVLAEGLPIHVCLEGTQALPAVLGDAGALATAFQHLVRNAAQASPGGVLRIRGERAGSDIVLHFADDGAGVPAEFRHRIFDPFFTTRTVGEGMGLGLTLVHFVARDHGGSVVVDPGEGGACFTLRLPAIDRRNGHAGWPLAAAILGTAACATVLGMLPPERLPRIAAALEVVTAFAAMLSLAAIGLRGSRRDRWLWLALASCPALWAAARLLPGSGPALLVLQGLADIPLAAALLLSRDPRQQRVYPRLAWIGSLAVLALVSFFQIYLVVLPAAFVGQAPSLATPMSLAGLVLRFALAGWAAGRAMRAEQAHTREVFGRVAAGLALWAGGATLAAHAAALSPTQTAGLASLGCILPFLVTASHGLGEVLGSNRGRSQRLEPAPPPHGGYLVACLLALALLPIWDAVLQSHSGLLVLDEARREATRWALVLVALLLAAREALAIRAGSAMLGPQPSRLGAVVGSAVHQLGAHLSALTALSRLLLAQSDLSTRAREDGERMQIRSERAFRIVNNLLFALPVSDVVPGPVAIQRLVDGIIEERREDLAQEGIRLRGTADEALSFPVEPTAVRQVLLTLVDNAAVALRTLGRTGTIEIAASEDSRGLAFVVSDDGPGLAAAARAATVHPESAGAGLEVGIAREIVKRHGGTLTARSRPDGGAEFTVRLPRPSHQGTPRKPSPGSGGLNGPTSREVVARR